MKLLVELYRPQDGIILYNGIGEPLYNIWRYGNSIKKAYQKCFEAIEDRVNESR